MLPSPDLIIDLIEAFRRSKTMFAAVSLGVFEALTSSPQPLSALSAKLGTNPDALERLLDACVGMGLLGRTASGYENTPVAATYLCKNSPHRLTGYINYSNAALWKMFDHLEDAVRGEPPFKT